MNNESSLYSLAHELLTLGMDGSPIYSDHFSRLNREVYEQALELYNYQIAEDPEEEAELCLSMLLAFNVTVYDNGRKRQYVQDILDRSWEVLPKLVPSLLKVRLLTYCYGEVYEEELVNEARAIINTWKKEELTLEQVEIMEELSNLEENQYPWEEVRE